MTDETNTTADETAGLKAKNSELLGKLKKAQAELEAAAAAKEEAEAEAATKSGDVEKIKQQLETKHRKELDALKASNETLAAELRTIRVDNEVNATIANLGIKTEFVPAVEALLHRKVTYEDGVATIDGKSIADWSKGWAAKEGAIYRPAPSNSGGDLGGNDGSKPSQFAIPKNVGEMTPELMSLAKSDPTQFNSIMNQAGFDIRA